MEFPTSERRQENDMQVNQIWNEIKDMKGLTLFTLDRHNPFEIIAITESAVTVLPKSTGKERPISRDGVENAYRHLAITGKLTLAEIETEYTPYNPVYVAAILAKIPGVQYKIKPIRLLISK
jgi:hypothetical protein